MLTLALGIRQGYIYWNSRSDLDLAGVKVGTDLNLGLHLQVVRMFPGLDLDLTVANCGNEYSMKVTLERSRTGLGGIVYMLVLKVTFVVEGVEYTPSITYLILLLDGVTLT